MMVKINTDCFFYEIVNLVSCLFVHIYLIMSEKLGRNTKLK